MRAQAERKITKKDLVWIARELEDMYEARMHVDNDGVSLECLTSEIFQDCLYYLEEEMFGVVKFKSRSKIVWGEFIGIIELSEEGHFPY